MYGIILGTRSPNFPSSPWIPIALNMGRKTSLDAMPDLLNLAVSPATDVDGMMSSSYSSPNIDSRCTDSTPTRLDLSPPPSPHSPSPWLDSLSRRWLPSDPPELSLHPTGTISAIASRLRRDSSAFELRARYVTTLVYRFVHSL